MFSRLKRFFSSGIVFHSRIERVKWWMGTLKKFGDALSILFVFIAISVYLGVFGFSGFSQVAHGMDNREVNISEAEIYEVEKRYDEDLEKGFCVYGYEESGYLVVEEVVHDSNPMLQERGRIKFTCIDETVERLPELLSSDLSLIGNIHTHPDNAVLSKGDVFSFGAMRFVQDTFGVYNGEELKFFTPESLSYSLNMNVENVISRKQYARGSELNI